MNVEAWDKIMQHRLKQLRNQAGAKGSELTTDKLVDACKKVVHEGTV